MAQLAIEYGVKELGPADAVAAALTAGDEPHDPVPALADGTHVSYTVQPTLDDLQHVAKQLLPKPTSTDFGKLTDAVIGANLKGSKRGKKGGLTQSAIWAGNVRRLAREIARGAKATARAAGKRSVRTAGKRTCATGAFGATDNEEAADDLCGSHANQQAPTIGVELAEAPGESNKYFVPAHAAVFRYDDAEGKCFANVNGDVPVEKLDLVGISTADGVESSRPSEYEVLRHTSVVTTGLVTLLCSKIRAEAFNPGDTVYVEFKSLNVAGIPLRRKQSVKIAAFTNVATSGMRVGRFIERCGPRGGIRVQLNIHTPQPTAP